MELLTRNNFENWMQKVMERLDRQDEMLLSMQPSGKAPNPMNNGTRTTAPVSSVAGLVAFVAVLPFTPGSL